MGFSYTKEQEQVITARNCNLLVSAAAGSGKTAVLTERIVRMVSDPKAPVDIDRLLIVTFTNAAAAEMRERISTALGKRLEAEPDNEHLQRQLTLLHNAQITTIDSFCLFIIRNNFNDIGLDPGFRVADEGELKLLRGEAMAELMEQCFEEGDEDFLNALESLNQNGDERTLMEYIERLYDFARSYPFPQRWLREAGRQSTDCTGEKAGRQGAEQNWLAFVKEDIRQTLSGCIGQLEAALRVCEQPEGPYMYAPTLEAERDMLEKVMQQGSAEAFAALSFGRLPSKKDESVSVQLREQVKGLRSGVKDAVEKLGKRYFFIPFEQAMAEMQVSSAMVRTLTELALDFDRRLTEKKQEKNVLDFGDMEHYALQILLEEAEDGSYRPSKTARDYRSYFHEIMIDEYQDSNLVQEYLLQSISGEAEGRYNRFMVGDVKQSIYRFRLARPEIFMEKYERYQTIGQADTQHKECRISLHQNFRSRREVTDSVNHVFSRIMGKELGGIIYDEEAALYPSAVYPEYENAGAELLLLAEDAEKTVKKAEQEAVLIAERIRRLKETYLVTDQASGDLRPVRYGDIAILLRSGSGFDETLKEVLKQYGIPAHLTASSGYFSSEEIRTTLHFLRILDNPLQDIPLFGVLRSPFGSFTENDIARLRALCPEGKLYEALQLCCGESEDMAGGGAIPDGEKAQLMDQELLEKGKRMLDLICRYRKKVPYEPVRTLLREFLAETGYMQHMTAFPGGEKRRANLEMLLLKAADFEKTGSHGLFAFIRYMEQLEKYEVDYGEAGIVDEHADVVRIMSIHKSKGLEFPVCIIAGLAKRFNTKDQSRSLLMDVDFGIGCEYVDTKRRLRRTTLRRNVLARKQQLDALGEELRILYVAMTRAREKLIMTATLPDPEKKLTALGLELTDGMWRQTSGKSSFLTLSTAGSLLDFLLPVWESIRVIQPQELAADEVEATVREKWRRQRLLEYTKEAYVEEWMQTFQERFAYQYPWDNLAQLYTKTTVSELKIEKMTEVSENALSMFDTYSKEAYVPRFCSEEQKQSGSRRGSAFHRVMELLDFANLPETQSVKELTAWVNERMQGFLADGRLSEEEHACIQPQKLAVFLCSDEARRMKAAARQGLLHKEQPFILGLAADQVKPEFPAQETVLIQGIIDVYWEEADGLVVLDYKTDRVNTANELTERYQAQLDYYSEALERITGKGVKEKLLYSFRLDETIKS